VTASLYQDAPNVVDNCSKSLGAADVELGSNALSDFCNVLAISHGLICLFGIGSL